MLQLPSKHRGMEIIMDRKNNSLTIQANTDILESTGSPGNTKS